MVTEWWFRVVVGDPLLEAEPFARITERFHARYPPDTAARLSTRLESNGGVHCVAVAYLSPEAADLAHEWGGEPVPCPPGM